MQKHPFISEAVRLAAVCAERDKEEADLIMCDFHLSQCLDETDCVDSVFVDSRCNMKDIPRDTFSLEDGLDLVVSKHPKTFRPVGILVLSGLRFMNYSIEDLVKETVVETRVNFCKTSRKFERSDSNSDGESDCTLCDTSNRSIGVHEQSMKLQAIVRGGGQDSHKVNFTMVNYQALPSTSGQPVMLSINEYSLSSYKNGDKVELNMEKVAKETLKHIDGDSDLARFLFIKRSVGAVNTMYESVLYPDWFIYTSADDKSVGMCFEDGPYDISLRTYYV